MWGRADGPGAVLIVNTGILRLERKREIQVSLRSEGIGEATSENICLVGLKAYHQLGEGIRRDT